jgi:NPCBM/NEW2 domain
MHPGVAMNALAHNNIMTGAFAALPGDLRSPLESVRPLLSVVGNYPDLFDDPTKPDETKDAIDSEWRRFCCFPETMLGRSLHRWPALISDQPAFQPIVRHWLQGAIDAYRVGDFSTFIKFIGCLSHYEGDVAQPAHVLGAEALNLLPQLLPPPAHLHDFHYHVDLEAVTGACGPLQAPSLLGTSVAEAAWRLAARNARTVREMKRYIVPTLEAIFAGNTAEAERLAEPPVTRAAQLTLDLLYTALRLAHEDIRPEERALLHEIDLREWAPDNESHDMVYGARAVLDGSRDTPPSGAPITPAKLRFPDGIRRVKGLGVLPHSGLHGPRECWMRYGLAPGTMARFECTVGLHSELAGEGSVDFVVDLDGKEAWRSGRRTAGDEALTVSIMLEQSRDITLKVEDANEGRTFWKNHAIWADPKLVKAVNV